MKTIIFLSLSSLLITSCHHADKEEIKKEIFQAEKAFEKMTEDKGIAEAFYYFADDSAVIKRENDTLIIGKDNIRKYYGKSDDQNTTVNWAPDYIDVSDDNTLAYTYGKYVWKIKNKEGLVDEFTGVF